MLNDFQDQILILWMSTPGGPFLVASCSQHILVYPGLWRNWKRAGEVGEESKRQTAGKEKKKRKENAFNLFTITVVLVPAEWVRCQYFSFFSRTCLCTQNSEGCWLTANSNCPEAIGSHFQTGSFIFPWKRKWSLPLILNHPPAAVYKVIRETLWQTLTHKHVCAHTKTDWVRIRCGHMDRDMRRVTREDKRWREIFSLYASPWCSQVKLEQRLQLWVMVCVTTFVVLPSKRKWGIHMDVVASCPENRDQRRRREKMRVPGRKETWKGLHFTRGSKRHWLRLLL